MIALPRHGAEAFTDLCMANPVPLPLIERADDPSSIRCAPGADLRTDLPRYNVHVAGELVAQPESVQQWWRDDLVGFLIGCSFTADSALMNAGIRLDYLTPTPRTPVYRSAHRCVRAGPHEPHIAVSMRPIERTQIGTAIEVTSALPMAHGGPIQVGASQTLGITDLAKPDWGSPLALTDSQLPVFWACGVTLHEVVKAARFDLAITHAPAHMFVTDVKDDAIRGAHPPLLAS